MSLPGSAPPASGSPLRIGLVGYGAGGRLFHAPFITAAEGVELSGVVARSESARAAVEADLPGVAVFPDLAALVSSAAVDAVTISTPPATRGELVLEAIRRGVHVIADKPFAPTAAAGQELRDAAARAGVVLNVYHNRRRDADLLTLRSVITAGRLGRVTRLHTIMDQAAPGSLETGPAGGLLRDLGSHMIDQHLLLLGPVTEVHATLETTSRFGAETDCAFFVWMRHAGGATSTASATKLNHSASRELRAYGDRGTYLAASTDVQARDLAAGRRPADDREHWGYEPPSAWGILSTEEGTVRVPSLQGDYTGFYEDFARAVAGGAAQPVPASDGVRVLRVLDAARESAASGAIVAVD
jgi:predicted dehydrogenase